MRMSVRNPYWSDAILACFDSDDPADDPSGDTLPSGEGDDTVSGSEDDPPSKPKGKTFTQDEVNKLIAKEKYRNRAALEQAESSYQELLENSQLTDQQRQNLQERLEMVQGQLRTKEQQAADEKKRLKSEYDNKLKSAQTQAQYWEGRFNDSTISRELQDAAVGGEAYNPAQIVTLLRSNTKLVKEPGEDGRPDEFKVVVDFNDVDSETGQPIVTTRTPKEAVERMKELPEIYGNLFRSNVVSGIGSGSDAGVRKNADGTVDLRELAKDPVRFRKMLKENPSVIMNAGGRK